MVRSGVFSSDGRNLHYVCIFPRVEFIQLALETKPLNLGQGFPDDLVPEYVPRVLGEVAQESILLNQYTRGFVRVSHFSNNIARDAVRV